MTTEKSTVGTRPKINKVEVYWHQVTYRSVLLYISVLLVLIFAAGYLVFPDSFAGFIRHVSTALQSKDTATAAGGMRGARFVNIEGKVQIKKANSVQWITADYQMTLDKGDLIQTGPDGLARLTFADGTNYTVQPQTLVTVEEIFVPKDSASSVGVHISAGNVDLTTGTWQIPGSKAEVSFQDAVASLHENSHADVKTDPNTKQNEITVASGAADVQRGGEQVQLQQYQRATFAQGGPITKTNILAPPGLVQPVNLQPIIVPDPKHTSIRFEWQPIATANEYELEISDTAMFNRLLADRRTSDTAVDVTGLSSGEYFWTVKAIDAKGTSSEAADPFKFSMVAQDKAQNMKLVVDPPEFHGKVVEISGYTEPGAALLVDGDAVADIGADGRFRYFTEQMTSGPHVIVITGQDRRGLTGTQRIPVVVP
ncbi:MAG TPA: hypothetical protein VKB26_05475 [Candidatus Acidoferrales bacterium]|nr:hypothetical protein [Candidatus Acidoferrales bacterium]